MSDWYVLVYVGDTTRRIDCADEGEARSKFEDFCCLYKTTGGACELRRSDVDKYVSFFSVTLPKEAKTPDR